MIEILQTKAWALESKFFAQMSPIILRKIAAGGNLSDLVTSSREEAPKIEAGEVYRAGKHLMFSHENGYFYQGEDEDHIFSRTNIKGTITKEGGLCSYGTAEIAESLQMKDEQRNVSAHILHFDSPGGAVDGTPELGNVIKNLSKPTISYVDGMAASAAYWLASQSDWLITNSLNYTQVGSIGTLCMLINEQGWLKKEGYKVEIIRAERSKDKARLNSLEDWPKESLNALQDEINQINADFISTVNAGRNGKLFTMGEDIFTGKMYDQKKALSMGMIDQIGTFEEALNTARQIAQNRKSLLLN